MNKQNLNNQNKKIIRLETINSFTGSKDEEYILPYIKSNEYLVDDSCFIPVSEAIKQLGNAGLSDSEINNYFDFYDGRDTGINVPLSRKRKDLAEISKEVFDRSYEIGNEINKAKQINIENIKFEEKLKNTSINE